MHKDTNMSMQDRQQIWLTHKHVYADQHTMMIMLFKAGLIL